MYVDVLRDGADPGGNLGTAFTASLAEQNLNPKGKYLDHLLLSLRGAVATAAVVLEDFVDLVTPFTFKAGQETRIQLRGRDLIALMAFMYGKTPHWWENTDATGNDWVLGIKIPIQEVIDPNQIYTHAATRVAVTNIATEQLALSAVYYDDNKGRKPIVAVELPYTTAAATGYTQIGVELPPLGKMIGLLVAHATVPTDGAIAFSIQRVQLLEGGAPTSKLLAAHGGLLASGAFDGTLSPIADVLKIYSAFDFRDEPIDVMTRKVAFSVDVEDASDATRLIAIIEKE